MSNPTAVAPAAHPANNRPLLLVVAVCLLVPALFADTTLAMAKVWLSNETYTHGFVILPLSLWLVWQNRARIVDLPLRADFRALWLILPCLAGWLLATLVDVQLVRQIAMISLIPLTLWLVAGPPLVLALLFPLLYLFFAVPLGQSLIPALMEFTADFTVYCVKASGIPVFRQGLSFSLPTGNWAVVEECSGLRYLIASAALGTLYAYISYRSWLRRSLFILAALIVPIIANGLRAYLIVMVGHLSNMQYAVGLDHLLYGWVFFGIVMLLMFYIGGFWAEDSQPGKESVSGVNTATANRTRASRRMGRREVAAAALAVTLYLGLKLALQVGAGNPATEDASLSLPASLGAWQETPGADTSWFPRHYRSSLSERWRFVSSGTGGAPVWLDVAWFSGGEAAGDAMSSLNKLTDPYGGDWNYNGGSRHQSELGAVTEARVRFGEDALLVWQIYRVGGQQTANPYLGKLYQASERLLRGRRDSAYITVATPLGSDAEAARARLADFWQAALPALRAQLDLLATPAAR